MGCRKLGKDATNKNAARRLRLSQNHCLSYFAIAANKSDLSSDSNLLSSLRNCTSKSLLSDFTFTLSNGIPQDISGGELIVAQLKDAGIRGTIKTVDYATLVEQSRRKDFDVYLGASQSGSSACARSATVSGAPDQETCRTARESRR